MPPKGPNYKVTPKIWGNTGRIGSKGKGHSSQSLLPFSWKEKICSFNIIENKLRELKNCFSNCEQEINEP